MISEVVIVVTLTLAGIAAGVINTVAGGGSLISLPIMILFGIPSTVANGTNRIAIIAQALPATFIFFKKGYKDIKQSIYIAIALIPGAVLGALAGVRMPDLLFNKILALIMIIVAISMAIRKYRHKNIYDTFAFSNNLKRKPFVYILLIGIGFYGGFIHVGIGFLLMFVLSSIGGMNLIQTNMHKVIAVVPYSIAALTVFFIGSSILWWAGIALAAGNMAGGWIGAHLSIKQDGNFIMPFFHATIFILILVLLLK